MKNLVIDAVLKNDSDAIKLLVRQFYMGDINESQLIDALDHLVANEKERIHLRGQGVSV